MKTSNKCLKTKGVIVPIDIGIANKRVSSKPHKTRK